MISIVLANPRGFCAGVDRAIEIVERALTTHGAPIYVRHEVVHNRFVVENLEKKGAVFVENLDEVPNGSILILVHTVFLMKCDGKLRHENLKCLMPPAL